jgi:hypothetical protein
MRITAESGDYKTTCADEETQVTAPSANQDWQKFSEIKFCAKSPPLLVGCINAGETESIISYIF